MNFIEQALKDLTNGEAFVQAMACLLYTSDAADEC